jgi:regulator of protease activity HflC (stomatin/prohibitin superfamily)
MATTSIFVFCFLGVVFLIVAVNAAFSIRLVKEGTRLSVYRLGRYLGDKGPGIVLVIPIIDRAVLKELGALLPSVLDRAFKGDL